MGIYNSECLLLNVHTPKILNRRSPSTRVPSLPLQTILIGFLVLLFHTSDAASSRDHQTRKLSWCEGVYLYYAQYFQIMNNEGAAKNLLFRASRTSAANFLINIEGDKVPSHRVLFIKQSRAVLKATLDSSPHQYLSEVSQCDKQITPLVSEIGRRNITLDGKTFEELQQAILSASFKTLGLN